MSHIIFATTLLGAAILTAMTGIAVERSTWTPLGQNISIRATRGDATFSGGGHEYFFEIINENASSVQVEVEVTKIDDEGRLSSETESFGARAGCEAGGERNTTIAHDVLSYRISAIRYVR